MANIKSQIKRIGTNEKARLRNKARYKATDDPGERRALALDGIARIDRQIETLRAKITRLRGMIADAHVRPSRSRY